MGKLYTGTGRLGAMAARRRPEQEKSQDELKDLVPRTWWVRGVAFLTLWNRLSTRVDKFIFVAFLILSLLLGLWGGSQWDSYLVRIAENKASTAENRQSKAENEAAEAKKTAEGLEQQVKDLKGRLAEASRLAKQTDSQAKLPVPLSIKWQPSPPGGLPAIEEISDFLDKSVIEKSPRVPPEKVNFRYTNATNVHLYLILFDYYYHYFPVNDPMAPRNAWRVWPLPATNRPETCSEFRRGTGWYTFFVERLDTKERYQLGTENIFGSEWQTLTVVATGDPKKPFKAVLATEK